MSMTIGILQQAVSARAGRYWPGSNCVGSQWPSLRHYCAGVPPVGVAQEVLAAPHPPAAPASPIAIVVPLLPLTGVIRACAPWPAPRNENVPAALTDSQVTTPTTISSDKTIPSTAGTANRLAADIPS